MRREKTFATSLSSCLTPRCTHPVHTRGVCRSCYQQLRGLWTSGVVTQEALERAGKIETVRTKKSHFLDGVAKSCLVPFLILTFTQIGGAHCLEGGFGTERAALYGSVVADFASTRIAMGRGARETNPVLGQAPGRQIAIMTVSTIAVDCLTNHLIRRQHPAGRWLRRSVIGLHAGLAGWNLSIGIEF